MLTDNLDAVERDDKYIELGRLAIRYAGEAKQYFYLDVLPCRKSSPFSSALAFTQNERPRVFAVQHIPEWVPFLNFQSVAKEARKVAHALRFDLFDLTKKRIVQLS